MVRKFRDIFEEAEEALNDPFYHIEKRELGRCQMSEGDTLWRHNIDGIDYCMYVGRFRCEFKKMIPLNEGAGYKCGRENGIPK